MTNDKQLSLTLQEWEYNCNNYVSDIKIARLQEIINKVNLKQNLNHENQTDYIPLYTNLRNSHKMLEIQIQQYMLVK